VIMSRSDVQTGIPAGASPGPDDLHALRSRLRGRMAGEASFDLSTRALYSSDASNYRVLPAAVVAPRTVDDVAIVVTLCRELSVPVTMRGAGTSIAGNSIGPGVLVDTSRHLNAVLDIDPQSQTATVLPGVVLDDLNRAAFPHGLRFGPDPSTHSRCTVGGMIGNNACGPRSVRWGTTAGNVLGLEFITTDGVRRSAGPMGPIAGATNTGLDRGFDLALRGLIDSNVEVIRQGLPPWPRRVSGYSLDWLLPERGYDVAKSLVGSEGTCAVVSAATLRLVRPPAARSLLILAFDDDIAAAAAVPCLLPEKPFTVESLTADLICGSGGGLLPPGGAWLLVETGGTTAGDAREHARRLVAQLGLAVGDSSTTLLEDPRAQASLWRMREDGAGSSARLPDGTPTSPGFEDAAVPPERLAHYLADLHALLRDQGLRGATYGHFGEGCVHLRVGFGLDRAGGVKRFESFVEAAADLVVAHGGTLSGEHGDGRARSALLPKMFGPELMHTFEQFKRIWDKGNLLNPGIIVDPEPFTASLRRPMATAIRLTPSLAHHEDGGDLRLAIDRCIGIGKCVTRSDAALMCPSYRAMGQERDSTRGRAHLLQEMVAGSLSGEGWRSTAVRDALDSCLSCKGCLSECPTGVDMASYKAEFLDHHYRGRLRPRSHYSLGWLPTWLRIASRMPRLSNGVLQFGPTRRVFAVAAGMARERTIPPLARTTFVGSYRSEPPPASTRGRVILWPDTFNNYMTPDVAHAAVRVIRAAGFEVAVPRAPVCCGLTWLTTGQLGHARRVLRKTLAAQELAGEEPIVVLEPSCASLLRRDLPEVLPGDPRAAGFARRVITLAELLDGISFTGLPADRLEALVQPHCHQQAVLGTDADRRVMERAGIDATTFLSGCCGLAGNFGAEAGHEGISRAVAALQLVPALESVPSDGVVAADGFSCRTQISFLTGRRARHLAEILADRLDEEVARAGSHAATK